MAIGKGEREDVKKPLGRGPWLKRLPSDYHLRTPAKKTLEGESLLKPVKEGGRGQKKKKKKKGRIRQEAKQLKW